MHLLMLSVFTFSLESVVITSERRSMKPYPMHTQKKNLKVPSHVVAGRLQLSFTATKPVK